MYILTFNDKKELKTISPKIFFSVLLNKQKKPFGYQVEDHLHTVLSHVQDNITMNSLPICFSI